MKKNKNIIFVAIALLVVGVIAFRVTQNLLQNKHTIDGQISNDLGIYTELASVKVNALSKELSYIGTIEPKQSVVLSSAVTLQVLKTNFQEGDYVNKGDIVGKLDNSQLVAARETIVKKIETMKVSYSYIDDEIQNYYKSNPMTKKIETIGLDYTYISDEEAKYRILYEQGIISKSAYDEVKHKKDMLGNQLEEAKASSEDAYSKLKNQKDTLEAQLKELNASLDELDIKIADTNMVAPISGKVRSIYYEPGDLAVAGKPFAVLDNKESIKAVVSVSEQDLGKIKVGGKVLLNIAGMGGSIESQVTRIMPSINANTRIGEVEIDFKESYEIDIATGTSVEVGFVTDEVDSGIVIKKSAIKTLKDKEFVYVVENSKAHQREIKTGLIVGDNVQVIEGLNTGEKIAAKNLSRIYDGASVYVAEGEE